MPTAVLDIEWTRLPAQLCDLERYVAAVILIRLSGEPVGSIRVPVVNGCVDVSKLHDAFMGVAGPAFRRAYIERYLGWTTRPQVALPTQPASIAVCTRDRVDDLRRCLQALARLPDDGQEVLVVDSCSSTDETRRVVESFKGVRYIREDRVGASTARNRALREARHDLIAFMDDDAVPDPGWLRALVRNFDDPLVMCVTGLTMPLELETPAQELFERYCPFARGFERKLYSSDRHNLLVVAVIGAGVNMALRRSALERFGGFDEALGPGTPTRSGEENDVFSRILLCGYRIVYEPSALNWHRHRRSIREVQRTIFGYGVGAYAAWTRMLLVEGESGVIRLAAVWLVRGHLRALGRSLLRRPGHMPVRLVLAELCGCTIGPWAYLMSRRRTRGRSG